MTQYHFVAASEAFLTVEEPLDEVLRERVRNYGEQGKEIDFWLVKRPAFLQAPELAGVAAAVPQPAAAGRGTLAAMAASSGASRKAGRFTSQKSIALPCSL